MPKHTSESAIPLDTSEIFDPAIRLNVLGELAENESYQSLSAEEQAIHRDRKLVQRSDIVHLFNRTPGYQERLRQNEAAMAPSPEEVTSAREEYLKEELAAINASRIRMGIRVLEISDIAN